MTRPDPIVLGPTYSARTCRHAMCDRDASACLSGTYSDRGSRGALRSPVKAVSTAKSGNPRGGASRGSVAARVLFGDTLVHEARGSRPSMSRVASPRRSTGRRRARALPGNDKLRNDRLLTFAALVSRGRTAPVRGGKACGTGNRSGNRLATAARDL
jgi:hypothetical protein